MGWRGVRCAVIGAGWWATTAHLPALSKHPLAEISAIQTLDGEKLHSIAEHFAAASASTSVDEALAIKDLDAAIISSTPNVHFPQARQALERGLHVLIEKPMTIRVDEAQSLVQLAEKKGLQFLISCPWHYTSHAIEARRLIQSGALGRLKMISILFTNFTLGFYQGLPWSRVFERNPQLQASENPYVAPGQSSYSDPKIAGGGQIYCQVSHAAAYIHFLTGRDPAEVFARFDNAGTAVDVYDTLNLKLDDGTLISMATAGASMLSERTFELRAYGTEGMLFMELWKGKMEFHDRDCNVTRYPDLKPDEIYPQFAPATNLVDVVAGRAANGSPARLGLFAMKITEAACESARTNQNVVL